MEKITITQPDDWHLHVRHGDMLKTVIPHTAKQFARAIIMPNLIPAITTVDMALDYRQNILDATPADNNFKPLMTLYLTDQTRPTEIIKGAENEHIQAFKLYPAGATTNSASGINDLTAIYPLLECMQKYDIPLLIHGEVTEPEIDIFDREKYFIERHLSKITQLFPELRIVLEHVTTQDAVHFVTEASQKVAATITPQHLLFNRNALLVGGMHPHFYCLPVLKREQHRLSLVKAATSGNPKFFLGTDSAPHLQHAKESACGCAGCFSAHAAMELYCQVFEQAEALDKLEAFASFHGPDFYQLPRNTSSLTLQKTPWTIPDNYAVNDQKLVPLLAGETMHWKVLSQSET